MSNLKRQCGDMWGVTLSVAIHKQWRKQCIKRNHHLENMNTNVHTRQTDSLITLIDNLNTVTNDELEQI